MGKSGETQFPCDSSLLPRCAFGPQNKIVSPQLSCRCSKHLEVDVLQNKRAIMPQCQSQKVKASLPTSHACPSTNVFTEKPAESPPSAFFHLPKEAKVTPLPNKSSLLRQPCGQFLQTPDTSSAVCAARHSP